VVEPTHAFAPRELSLDVRLAGGVRKELVFALVDERTASGGSRIEWLSVERVTP
jgi:tRNA-intron endonuclease